MELNTQHERTSSETSDDDSGAQYRVNNKNICSTDKVVNRGKIATYYLGLYSGFLALVASIIRAPLNDLLPKDWKSIFDGVNVTLSAAGLASGATYSLFKNFGTYEENKKINQKLIKPKISNGGALMLVGASFSLMAIGLIGLYLFISLTGLGLTSASSIASLGLGVTSMIIALAGICCICLGHQISASSLRKTNRRLSEELKKETRLREEENKYENFKMEEQHKKEIGILSYDKVVIAKNALAISKEKNIEISLLRNKVKERKNYGGQLHHTKKHSRSQSLTIKFEPITLFSRIENKFDKDSDFLLKEKNENEKSIVIKL